MTLRLSSVTSRLIAQQLSPKKLNFDLDRKVKQKCTSVKKVHKGLLGGGGGGVVWGGAIEKD